MTGLVELLASGRQGFGTIAAGLMLVMVVVWAFTLWPGRSGWIDVIWSLATGVASALAALVVEHNGSLVPRQMLVSAVALIWGLRLGLHIAGRTKLGHDDPRYAQLREQWGRGFAIQSFFFLQIQAIAAMMLAAVVAIAAHNPAVGWRLLDVLGVMAILGGVGFEAMADRQLRQFRADPANAGQICDRGLWGLSRHPNYFGEWLVWAGFALIAIAPAGGYALGWLALAGPVLMYGLLVYGSGIPPLEAHMLRSRGAQFRAYQARVNAFWPWPPRSAGQSTKDNQGSQP